MGNFEKDKLTFENIILDYKIIFFNRIKYIILGFIIFVPFSCLLIYFIAKINFIYKLILGFFLLLILWFLCLNFFAIFKECKSFREINNKKFRIEVDILNQKEETTVGRKFITSTMRILYFNKYKMFSIPEFLEFRSAEKFNFNQRELYDTSKIEDEFYLVINHKNEIILAYNKNFFEFQE